MGERLNKYIAFHTKYSRREADKLIEQGLVKIGKRIARPGEKVEPDEKVFIKGAPLKKRKHYTVIAYHKPRGVLVTKKDDRERTTIYHLLPGKFRHFIPVGRLDYASEGLLLLTDAPDVASALMESSLPRAYNIKIEGALTPEMIEAMERGLELEDAAAGAHPLNKTTSMHFKPFASFKIRSQTSRYTKLRVVLTEGKNREIRRFFAHFGAKVLDLKRVTYGWVELNNLPQNKTRYLDKDEYAKLHRFLEESKKSR